MACVVLPLLPEGPYGPFGGVRPRELWALVLFFSALSFLGHVARRLVGPDQGYLVTGLIGGLVSSTNVTFTFARLSRSDRGMERALAFGAVGANAVLYGRIVAATAVLNAALVAPLIPYLAMPAVVAGLTDVDALTVSMARGVAKTVSLEAAALAIAVGVLANTAVKLGIAVVFGSARYRALVGGTLMLMIVSAAAALVLL